MVLGSALFAPIDRTPIQEQEFFNEMVNSIDIKRLTPFNQSSISTSWARINITPTGTWPMAGYKLRSHFESVHDSLFARLLYLEIDARKIAIINIDLLIFPPLLNEAIKKKLDTSQSEVFIYQSATHTHNGIGGWDDSILGKFVSGTYHKEWIEDTANKIVEVIKNQKAVKSSISYWESNTNDLVVNRIAYSKGEEDGTLRGLEVTRADSTKALLFSFSAHPTSITKKSLALSADYPGKVIELIEQDFDFGIFLSGMVGSHSFENLNKQNFDLVDLEGELVNQRIESRKNFLTQDSISISIAHVPIEFGPSQLRISKNWKARNWVLSFLFGGLRGELTYLRLGDIVMIGTPCDFSGEIFVRDNLEMFAAKYNRHLMITSFNGDYVGYITYDGHYDSIKNAETREMNWVGPYYGEYFSTMIKKLIEKDTVTF